MVFKATHGQTDTPLWNAWAAMIRRCYLPNHKSYRYYGGRGVKVYNGWRYSFTRFQKWALANGYEDGLTLDRISVDGNYEPRNCRWIPQQQQMWNRRDTPRIKAFGEAKSIPEWAQDPHCTVKYNTLRERLRRGWEPERAITWPA